MPVLMNERPAVGQPYEEKTTGWYTERLLVFFPTHTEGRANALIQDNLDVRIGRSLETLAESIEAPFVEADSRMFAPMSEFIVRAGGDGAPDHLRDKINKKVGALSRTLGLEFEPSIATTRMGKEFTTGVFTGRALYAPRPNDQVRGSVRLTVDYSLGNRLLQAQFEVMLSDTGMDTPAAFYPAQDRVAFGTEEKLPAWLKQVASYEVIEGEVFKLDRIEPYRGLRDNYIALILPASTDMSKASFLMTERTVCADAAQVLVPTSDKPVGDRPVSVIAEGTDRSPLRARHINPSTGWADINVSDTILTDDRRAQGDTAGLRVTPNSAVSRLRTRADRGPNGLCEVRAIMLPSPTAFSDVSECVVNLTPDYGLLPHFLEQHGVSILVQSEQSVFSRSDVLSVATALRGIEVEQRRLQNARETSVVDAVRLTYLHYDRGLGISRNPDEGSAILQRATSVPADEFILLRPREPGGRPLGFFELPLPPTLTADHVDAEAEVTFIREDDRLGRAGQVCLDWLDDAVQVICEDSGNRLRKMGYAAYWVTGPERKYPESFSNRSRFYMDKMRDSRGSNVALHYQAPASGDNAGQNERVYDGVFLWIGPLLVQWRKQENTS